MSKRLLKVEWVMTFIGSLFFKQLKRSGMMVYTVMQIAILSIIISFFIGCTSYVLAIKKVCVVFHSQGFLPMIKDFKQQP
jgi:hypothetical protein